MSFENIAEEKIREAIEQGAFTSLAGEGRPLKHKDDDFAGDDRMGLHILRENGFLPEWLELRKQVFYERDLVIDARERWIADIKRWGSQNHPVTARSKAIYRQRVAAINAKIDLHNVRCPSIDFEIARYADSD